MKKLITTILGTTLFASIAYAAVTVDYYNRDSVKYEFDAVCSGSKYTVTFNASTSGATTIQGSAPCKVAHKGGEIVLKGGEKVEIKDGVITIK